MVVDLVEGHGARFNSAAFKPEPVAVREPRIEDLSDLRQGIDLSSTDVEHALDFLFTGTNVCADFNEENLHFSLSFAFRAQAKRNSSAW